MGCVWNIYCKSTLCPLSHAELVLFHPQRRVSAALIPPFKLLLTASQSDSVESWRGNLQTLHSFTDVRTFPLLVFCCLPLCLYLSCLDAYVCASLFAGVATRSRVAGTSTPAAHQIVGASARTVAAPSSSDSSVCLCDVSCPEP